MDTRHPMFAAGRSGCQSTGERFLPVTSQRCRSHCRLVVDRIDRPMPLDRPELHTEAVVERRRRRDDGRGQLKGFPDDMACGLAASLPRSDFNGCTLAERKCFHVLPHQERLPQIPRGQKSLLRLEDSRPRQAKPLVPRSARSRCCIMVGWPSNSATMAGPSTIRGGVTQSFDHDRRSVLLQRQRCGRPVEDGPVRRPWPAAVRGAHWWLRRSPMP